MMWNGPFGGAGGWGAWGWFGPLHWLMPLLFWALIIAAVVALVRYATGRRELPPPSAPHATALDVLEERYARGEIGRDEYLQKKRDILG